MSREQILGLTGVVILMGAAATAVADTRENPYQTIVHRNPFGLRAAVVVVLPPRVETPAPPAREIKLTGIFALLGRQIATFQYEDRQTRKVEYSALLTEGQGDETVTVLQIDPVNSLVRVRSGQTESTLDFIHNGVKPTVAPPVPVPPVLPALRVSPLNPSDRVIIGNPPSLSRVQPAISQPTMSRDQAEAIIERRRQELRALEDSGQSAPGRGSSSILPPTRLGERRP